MLLFSTSCIFGCDLTYAEAAHLHKTLVIFQIGASPRERQVFLLTIGDQRLIDEFPTVIGINPQNGKREECACALESSQDRLLAPMQEGETFRPPSPMLITGYN